MTADLKEKTDTVVWTRRDLLSLEELNRGEIELLLDTADSFKEVSTRRIKKVPALRGKTIANLFFEASTRTHTSFELAAKRMSADTVNFQRSNSSVEKGESLVDTAKNIVAMQIDTVVVRHPSSGAAELLARELDVSVVNAGDGMHEHPTQGLLDLYTIKKRLGAVDGKKVTIVGDLLYSRVARSNLWGLTKMGAKVVLCGPRTLIPNDFLNGSKKEEGHPFASVEIETDIDKALKDADVVMALRLQLERQHAGHLPSLREYSQTYGINSRRLMLAKENALVMHPGPVNEGIEIESDVAHGAQSVIEEQVTNGVAVRMALLYSLATGSRHEPEFKEDFKR